MTRLNTDGNPELDNDGSPRRSVKDTCGPSGLSCRRASALGSSGQVARPRPRGDGHAGIKARGSGVFSVRFWHSVVCSFDEVAYWALVVESILRRLKTARSRFFLETLMESRISPSLVVRKCVPSEFEGMAHWHTLRKFFSGSWKRLQTPCFAAFPSYTKHFLSASAQNFLAASAHGQGWLSGVLGPAPRTSTYFGRASFEVKHICSLQDCCCVGSNPLSLMHFLGAHE